MLVGAAVWCQVLQAKLINRTGTRIRITTPIRILSLAVSTIMMRTAAS